jgi:ribonuclease BN (tRNA processing enzyme)
LTLCFPQNTSAPFAGIARNPTVDLNFNRHYFKDLDFVIVTHTHSDHFDTLASEASKRHQIILPTCRQRIYGKANFVNAEVIKQKQPLKILPSQEQAENTEVKYWHRWERFLDSYCKPKTNRLIYCWRQHLGGRGRKCNHNF